VKSVDNMCHPEHFCREVPSLRSAISSYDFYPYLLQSVLFCLGNAQLLLGKHKIRTLLRIKFKKYNVKNDDENANHSASLHAVDQLRSPLRCWF